VYRRGSPTKLSHDYKANESPIWNGTIQNGARRNGILPIFHIAESRLHEHPRTLVT
jgi:hypothetical protein